MIPRSHVKTHVKSHVKSTREAGTQGSSDSLDTHPALLGEFWAGERPCLKTKEDSTCGRTWKVNLWTLKHACTHKLACTHAHTHTQVCNHALVAPSSEEETGHASVVHQQRHTDFITRVCRPRKLSTGSRACDLLLGRLESGHRDEQSHAEKCGPTKRAWLRANVNLGADCPWHFLCDRGDS